MNLKRLELRGFKTFSHPTEFLFPSGITALVGPNGSGKSNVADAIRWVLGEQSLRAVRGKRTEDVIFAGSANRPPAGMAEVALTLDNTSGWLPLAFSEVKISRRAYRSGENEYLLNNNRVRLRDLNELLLKAGLADSAYVVVGQGMIDVALSLRADERRELIDEAADLKRFYVKLQETRDKLATTEQGLMRARDLMAEIAPRVAGLAEQANRLRRHQELSAELRHLLRIGYRHVCDQVSIAVDAAAARLDSAEQEAADLRLRFERGAEQLVALESAQAETKRHLESWRREADQQRERAEALRRKAAVLVERREAQRQLQRELQQEWEVLQRSQEAARQEVIDAETLSTTLEAEVAAAAAALAHSEVQYAVEARGEEELLARISQTREDVVRLRERMAALGDQRLVLHDRHTEMAAERARWQETLATNRTRMARVSARAEELRRDIDNRAIGVAAVGTEATKLRDDIAAAEEALRPMADQLRRLARELDERRGRLDVLESWRDSHAAYSVGVRAVLQAAVPQQGRAPLLPGIVGVAVDLVRAPQELETAVEVTLAGRAQDIVVERWKDAEAAIALLKASGAGRATFLPLDTLRVPGRSSNPVVLREKGVRGVAADLVDCDRRFQPVIELLLGRTLVAEDLAVARRVLDICSVGWQIVTVEGEIVRTTGAVTGGARRSSEVGLLARQRELRTLRQAVPALESESATLAERLAAEREVQAARRRQLAGLEDRRRDCEAALRGSESALAAVNAEARFLAEEQRRVEAVAARHLDDCARVDGRLRVISAELVLLEQQGEAARQLLGTLEGTRIARAAEQRGVAEGLAAQRTALAVKQRELAGRRELLVTLHAGLTQAEARLKEKEARLAELASAAQSATAEALSAAADLAQLEVDFASLDGLIASAATRLMESEAIRRALERDDTACREQMAMAEATRREAAGELNRAREQAVQARQQAEGELGPAVAAEVWGDPEAGADEAEQISPQEVKRHVDHVRGALRQLGMVNPQAIVEHEEVAARHDFLAHQVTDLEEAAKVLRRLSTELQKTMRRRFEEAYIAVGNEFRHYFTRLFGGGTARLVLTPAEDLEQTGIEIVAQPPGRRLQSLALLSGGERALTAVALLFAVLAVRPIPFCVLDEADAALDEANVGRFGEALRDLAERTQFIVITHSRGTMQVANSLYGISMPADSISQLVSLRLAGNATGEELPYVRSAATPR